MVVMTSLLGLCGLGARAERPHFRNDIVKGPGGQQIPLEDPSGHVVELFQPAATATSAAAAALISQNIANCVPSATGEVLRRVPYTRQTERNCVKPRTRCP